MPKTAVRSLFDDVPDDTRRPVRKAAGDHRGETPYPQRCGSADDLSAIVDEYDAGKIGDDHMGRIVNTCVSQLRGWELATVARVVRDLLRGLAS